MKNLNAQPQKKSNDYPKTMLFIPTAIFFWSLPVWGFFLIWFALMCGASYVDCSLGFSYLGFRGLLLIIHVPLGITIILSSWILYWKYKIATKLIWISLLPIALLVSSSIGTLIYSTNSYEQAKTTIVCKDAIYRGKGSVNCDVHDSWKRIEDVNQLPPERGIKYYDPRKNKYKTISKEELQNKIKEALICEGTRRIYYDNGQVSVEVSYQDNEVKSEIYYYRNGRLQRMQRYKDGHKESIDKEYYENGQLKQETFYKNDWQKKGKEKFYYKNGQLEIENFYNENGQLDGICKTYDKNGNLIEERVYKNGSYIRKL